MTVNRIAQKIMIVDDEAESSILRSVRQRLEDEGWQTTVVSPSSGQLHGRGV